MMNIRFISRYSTAIVASAILLLPTIVGAQVEEKPIRIESYDIVIMELKKPVMRLDIDKNMRDYDKAYIVTVKGDFPIYHAEGMELFIGDYSIPEYGATKDGLYFKIYDPRLFGQLEGKSFRYRFETDEIRDFKLKFSLRRLQPLKTIKEK